MGTAGSTSTKRNAMVEIKFGRVSAMQLDSFLQESIRHIDAALPKEKFFIMHRLLNEMFEMVRRMNGLGWPEGIHLIELLI